MHTISEKPKGKLFDHTVLTLPGGTKYEACAVAYQPKVKDEPELMSGVFHTIPLPMAFDFYIIDINYDSYLTVYACLPILKNLKLEVGLVFTKEADPTRQTVIPKKVLLLDDSAIRK